MNCHHCHQPLQIVTVGQTPGKDGQPPRVVSIRLTCQNRACEFYGLTVRLTNPTDSELSDLGYAPQNLL